MSKVVELTDEEKFEMYMKVPHEELVRMKIEEEKSCKHPFSKEQLIYLNSHFQRKPNYKGGPG